MGKAINLKELLSESEGLEEKIKDLAFEQGLSLLEELVTKVESGSLPLEVAVSSYEKGSMLLKHLQELLAGAEKKLEVLKG